MHIETGVCNLERVNGCQDLIRACSMPKHLAAQVKIPFARGSRSRPHSAEEDGEAEDQTSEDEDAAGTSSAASRQGGRQIDYSSVRRWALAFADGHSGVSDVQDTVSCLV